LDVSNLAAHVAAHLHQNKDELCGAASPLPDLLLVQHVKPTEMSPTLYEPGICLTLQGRKETVFGETILKLGPGESSLVSHDIPVISRITVARPDEPYLAIIVMIDLSLLRGLYEELGNVAYTNAPARSLAATATNPRLLDCLSRYLAVASDPVEKRVMAPSLRRELHFRLLTAPHGGMLRALLRYDSHPSSIARAISQIRRDFRTPIAVADLAREVGMSPSSFHKHFRDITSTTPLQYQKELRLLEARRLLSKGEHLVSKVAYEVGYESPTQFSREYSRKFGVPPRLHLHSA